MNSAKQLLAHLKHKKKNKKIFAVLKDWQNSQLTINNFPPLGSGKGNCPVDGHSAAFWAAVFA